MTRDAGSPEEQRVGPGVARQGKGTLGAAAARSPADKLDELEVDCFLHLQTSAQPDQYVDFSCEWRSH